MNKLGGWSGSASSSLIFPSTPSPSFPLSKVWESCWRGEEKKGKGEEKRIFLVKKQERGTLSLTSAE